MLSILPMTSTNIMTSKEFFDLIWADVFCDKKISILKNQNSFKVDLKETVDTYFIEADLPGVIKENIQISYINKFLVISTRRLQTKNNTTTINQERIFGEYKRMFYLGNIDITTLKTNYENGELKLSVKKSI